MWYKSLSRAFFSFCHKPRTRLTDGRTDRHLAHAKYAFALFVLRRVKIIVFVMYSHMRALKFMEPMLTAVLTGHFIRRT